MRQRMAARWMKNMTRVLFAGVVGVFGGVVVAGSDAAVPEELTPETFEAIAARVTPTPEELAWQKVGWRDGFFDGVVEAQAADKPIFYWIYEGDPRGRC